MVKSERGGQMVYSIKYYIDFTVLGPYIVGQALGKYREEGL